MKVTVRDRSAESAWGSGPINPCVVTVEIADNCPVPGCGAKRGEPRHLRQCDDGAWYSVQVWDNPCGHVDMYEAVVREAKALAQAAYDKKRAARDAEVEHFDAAEAADALQIERDMAVEAGMECDPETCAYCGGA